MRTKQIDGSECVLMCGGPNFKIYSSDKGWIIFKGKKQKLITPEDKEYKFVRRYVTLKYEPLGQVEFVKNTFNEILGEM
jgi:hypothetical protein